MRSDAIISPCGKFRYRLRRDVPHAMRGANFIGGTCLFVMLNPSTADATADDPTIRRCRGFALEWGRLAMEVVNLFAIRSTDPKQIKAPFSDAIGPDNDAHIMEACMGANLVVCAWGQGIPSTAGRIATNARADEVLRIIRSSGNRPYRIGPPTKKGAPPHPLYLRTGLALEEMP